MYVCMYVCMYVFIAPDNSAHVNDLTENCPDLRHKPKLLKHHSVKHTCRASDTTEHVIPRNSSLGT